MKFSSTPARHLSCAAFLAFLLFARLGDVQAQEILPSALITPKDQAVMVLIPAGEFTYGIRPSERKALLKRLGTPELQVFEREFDKKRIRLPNYYIDKFEVTNAQYARFIEDTGHPEPMSWDSSLNNGPRRPVANITWRDAEAYASWAGKRLPSEEEWEKAARGTDGNIWPWGNKPSGGRYNGKSQGNYRALDVGSFERGASPYGIMDMAGNVYEMTTGTWKDNRAMRGGSYLNAGAYTRTMFRWALKQQQKRAKFLGFRCVMDSSNRGFSETIAVQKPPAETWGVVYGADQGVDAARYEVTTAANKHGINNAAIYYRKGWYRSVATSTDKAEAETQIAKAKGRNEGAYLVRMSSWCPNPEKENGHYTCSESPETR